MKRRRAGEFDAGEITVFGGNVRGAASMTGGGFYAQTGRLTARRATSNHEITGLK